MLSVNWDHHAVAASRGNIECTHSKPAGDSLGFVGTAVAPITCGFARVHPALCRDALQHVHVESTIQQAYSSTAQRTNPLLVACNRMVHKGKYSVAKISTKYIYLLIPAVTCRRGDLRVRSITKSVTNCCSGEQAAEQAAKQDIEFYHCCVDLGTPAIVQEIGPFDAHSSAEERTNNALTSTYFHTNLLLGDNTVLLTFLKTN